MTVLRIFWTITPTLDPGIQGERQPAGTPKGRHSERFRRAESQDVVSGALQASADYADSTASGSVTFGVGPAGECFRSLPADRRSVYARRATQSFPTDHSLFTPARGTRWPPVPPELPFIARGLLDGELSRATASEMPRLAREQPRLQGRGRGLV